MIDVDVARLRPRTRNRIRRLIRQLVANGGPHLTLQQMCDRLVAASAKGKDG